jgi:hypothetical protein
MSTVTKKKKMKNEYYLFQSKMQRTHKYTILIYGAATAMTNNNKKKNGIQQPPTKKITNHTHNIGSYVVFTCISFVYDEDDKVLFATGRVFFNRRIYIYTIY